MSYTRDDILRLCKELNVQFVYLQLTDIFGVLKSVTIPVRQLPKALDNELMFDGSSVEGYVRIEESDMYLWPDLSTFVVFPWRLREGAEARLICDVYNPDGTPAEGCPRGALKKVLAEAKQMGYTYNVGPEMEFFLFLTDEKGAATVQTHDRAAYFDLAPVDLGENARREMVITLEEMGFEVEASHHEVAPGQHEIDFKYSEALRTADNVLTCKHVVRVIAKRHGLHASFMPKPIYGIPGSGMHCHQSLFSEDGKNAFYDPDRPRQLSDTAMHFLAGLLYHAGAISAVTNPTVNSYKRLVSGFEAPVYIAWSERNRSPLVRIPARRGIGTRLEVRNPDPSCNPYLALAVMLKAGLDGIKKKMVPPPPVDQNIYDMSEEELNQLGIKCLPTNLKEAIDELDKDEVVKEALGVHIYQRFREAKLKEWERYRAMVHPWEVEEYLTMF